VKELGNGHESHRPGDDGKHVERGFQHQKQDDRDQDQSGRDALDHKFGLL
jgi:hypothetical protein